MSSLDQELSLLLVDQREWRRPRSLENLVKGKRTVATLYWGLRYQLLGLLGIARYLEVSKLDFVGLEQQRLLQTNAGKVRLTPLGAQQQAKLKAQLQMGWKVRFQTTDLMRLKHRFLLLIQVASEYHHHQNQYFVLKTSLREQQWIKRYFGQLRSGKKLEQFPDNVSAFLAKLPEVVAQVVGAELVGYHNNGRTRDQIAQELCQSSLAIAFLELTALAALVDWGSAHPDSLLTPLKNGLERGLISKNAVQTLRLYQANHSLKQVARKQRIRLSTVQEHLLEVAIYLPIAQFPYLDFVSAEMKQDLMERLGTDLDDWQFEAERDSELSFFQFRLIQIWITKGQREDQKHGSAD
ncbi:helix-turn-helix domain-containing protein [Fructilactobacillus hinvesii]|uniref:Helix-turn-helix domain-containing protein n=1 Tax=Fructilactobacillus hinvesii TaxID=2940300 RepID=A0ABY5BSI9_9LACO|nr:helix-turn-helix domain-containing protein [Fructilactobacillus hinvesii]USS87407.1 helix-turn-helix domain-containing protein [Fructilactobacillus hinvesii]